MTPTAPRAEVDQTLTGIANLLGKVADVTSAADPDPVLAGLCLGAFLLEAQALSLLSGPPGNLPEPDATDPVTLLEAAAELSLILPMGSVTQTDDLLFGLAALLRDARS